MKLERTCHGCSEDGLLPHQPSLRLFPYAIVEAGAEIGEGTKVESFSFVEAGAVIGARCTIKLGVYVWRGVEIGDDVFVAHNVSFTNDSWPKTWKDCPIEKTFVGHGASIGAGAVILPGVIIPPHSMVAAGAVVRTFLDPPYQNLPLLFTREGNGYRHDPRVDADAQNCSRCNPKKGEEV